jgi:hypothetical protein
VTAGVIDNGEDAAATDDDEKEPSKFQFANFHITSGNLKFNCDQQHQNCTYIGIDSCTSIHVFNDIKLFDTLEPVKEVTTTTADNGMLTVNKMGTARFTVINRDGTSAELVIYDAYYAPNAALSLLSTTLFAKKTHGGFFCKGDGATAYDKQNDFMFDGGIKYGVPMLHVIPNDDNKA